MSGSTEKPRERSAKVYPSPEVSPRCEISFAAFELGASLGSGAFATVQLVKLRQTGELFAIKRMLKRQIIKTQAAVMTWNERWIMQLVSTMSPEHAQFMCPLLCSFQTPNELCFVMPVCLGGDLVHQLVNHRFKLKLNYAYEVYNRSLVEYYQAIAEMRPGYPMPKMPAVVTEKQSIRVKLPADAHGGGFDEVRVKWFAAELLLALQGLHHHDIVFRDLKLKNILMDKTGHLRLSDFGLAAKLKPVNNYRMRRRAGTPGYMPPEMLGGKDYGFEVDFFSLGVVIFELFHGHACFRHERILKLSLSEVLAPEVWIHGKIHSSLSPEGLDIITKLLHLDVHERLGYTQPASNTGIDEIFEHPWFADIDWQLVKSRCFPPELHPKTVVTVLQGDPYACTIGVESAQLKKRGSGSPSIPKKYNDFFNDFEWGTDNLELSSDWSHTVGRLDVPQSSCMPPANLPTHAPQDMKVRHDSVKPDITTVSRSHSETTLQVHSPDMASSPTSPALLRTKTDLKRRLEQNLSTSAIGIGLAEGSASFMGRDPKLSDVGLAERSWIQAVDSKHVRQGGGFGSVLLSGASPLSRIRRLSSLGYSSHASPSMGRRHARARPGLALEGTPELKEVRLGERKREHI
jgi:serine/threonine protein kinase